MTDLLNRRGLAEALDDDLASADRTGEPLAVIALDLDGLKRVNDDLGHAAGDRLIVDVAAAMRRHARRSDRCARVGGDEFVVVLARTEASGAARFVERLLGDPRCPATTAGIAVRQPGEEVSAMRLLDEADRELIAAKRARPAGLTRTP